MLVSVLADPFGLGGSPMFDYKQVIGTIGGAIAAIVGLILTLRE